VTALACDAGDHAISSHGSYRLTTPSGRQYRLCSPECLLTWICEQPYSEPLARPARRRHLRLVDELFAQASAGTPSGAA
jgi:hypothetical protein